jgi:hypothetical protein
MDNAAAMTPEPLASFGLKACIDCGQRLSAAAGYSCESRLSLVSKPSNRSAEYTCPLGAVIETEKPSVTSLRASVTAMSALDRKSVVRRLSFTDSIMNVIDPRSRSGTAAHRKPSAS